jgi:hypothetical protein
MINFTRRFGNSIKERSKRDPKSHKFIDYVHKKNFYLLIHRKYLFKFTNDSIDGEEGGERRGWKRSENVNGFWGLGGRFFPPPRKVKVCSSWKRKFAVRRFPSPPVVNKSETLIEARAPTRHDQKSQKLLQLFRVESFPGRDKRRAARSLSTLATAEKSCARSS